MIYERGFQSCDGTAQLRFLRWESGRQKLYTKKLGLLGAIHSRVKRLRHGMGSDRNLT